VKVAYILRSFPSVSETFITDEIVAVMRQGIDCHVISLLRPRRQPHHEHAEAILKAGRVSYLGTGGLLGKYRSLFGYAVSHPIRVFRSMKHVELTGSFRRHAWVTPALCAEIDRYGPDLLHAHYANLPGECAWAAHRTTGIPFAVTTHGHDVFFYPPDDYRGLAEAAEAVVCVSEFNRRYLSSRFGVPYDKLRVIHCGVDLKAFTAPYRPAGGANGLLKILCVARLTPVKGHRYVLEALRLLRQDGIASELVLVGDGPLRKELEEYAAELGVTSAVRFRGALLREEVLSLLRECHLFVLPSLSEAMPISLMEAMACRVPVIATAVHGVPELVVDKVTGLLVPVKSPEAIVESVRWVMDHPAEVEQMVERGRAKVAAEFEREKCAQQLTALWRDIV